MLDNYQHYGAKGDDPQQVVSVSWAAFNIGGPVPWINEADSDQKTWPQKAQNRPEMYAFFVNHVTPLFNSVHRKIQIRWSKNRIYVNSFFRLDKADNLTEHNFVNRMIVAYAERELTEPE